MKYTIITNIISARGFQEWSVDAESEEEAIQLFEQGECEFISEEIEITDCEFDNVKLEEE